MLAYLSANPYSTDVPGGAVTHRYDGVLNGFAARISQDQLDAFREDTDRFDSPISYVELDSEITIQ